MLDRHIFIDILKGISILLIVYGHVIPGFSTNLTEYISTFNIPVFFFVSGLLFNNEKYKNAFLSFLKGRIKGLIIPYVLLSVIVLIGYYFLNKMAYLSFVEHCFVYGWGGYALWFIPVLFFVEMLYYIISNLNLKWIVICLFISSIVSYVSSNLYGYINYNILLIFCGIYFYGIGNLCRRYLNLFYMLRFKQLFLFSFFGFIISLLYAFTNTHPEWFINKIPSFIYYITPLGAIFY